MRQKNLADWIEKEYTCYYCGRKFTRQVRVKVPAINKNVKTNLPGRHAWSSMVQCECGNFLKT